MKGDKCGVNTGIYGDKAIGKKFSKLTVLRTEKGPKRKQYYWWCRCDCGNEIRAYASNVLRGNTNSCGCHRLARIKEAKTTHGKSHSPEWNTWMAMLDRCYDSKNDMFHRYGGRGIKVCDKWRASFISFYQDMGDRPSKTHSLDRIDLNGNYCKENCRWATREEQALNTSRTVWITYDGHTRTVREWSKIVGLSESVIRTRFKKGLSIKKVLFMPSGMHASKFSE